MAFELVQIKTRLWQVGIDAYRSALQQDKHYALAWYNLGGVLWNTRCEAEAISIWKEAIRRFPEHELSQKLRDDLPFLRTYGIGGFRFLS